MLITFWRLAFLTALLEFAVTQSQDQEVNVETGYDPGPCNKDNHGKLKLVKNREEEDRLLVCSQKKGAFNWKTTDGSFTLGEYISPGYDCSDILNKHAKAKDGFYWIHLGEKTPQKVWCDMKTDSGGFILFGYQNSSVTWDVPSNNETVDPNGLPHWSSVLGNTPILDVRIQVSSSKEFKDTKADWSFRLRTKRPLKNLMVMGEKGCDGSSPGIGDIAYVKNLKTEKIVTTKFRCSKFGIAYHVGTMFGWESMNFCLQKPCPLGFAFHKHHPIQIDFFGAFSYSVNGTVSGPTYNASAFVGCDQGKCCACYGPDTGTKDYCTDDCQSINGGTVSKNVHVWFWVRSKVPRRLWRKCMEFQSQGENGNPEWYKLIQDNPTPVKGRCKKQKVLLNEGVVVVPNGAMMTKIPPIQGLLMFRKDINQLYLRSGSNWRRIADESAINSRASQLERRIVHLESTTAPQLGRRMTSLENDITLVKQLENRLVSLESRLAQQTAQSANRSQQLERKIRQIHEQYVGRVRLSGGTSNTGRVEIYHRSYGWGTICDDAWDINDGHVVCRQLGFSRATAVRDSAYYGQGTGDILLDDVECNGNEQYLWDCTHRGWNVDNCSHSEDASVDCQ